MLHLLGVNLPDQKVVRIALTYFYGVGHPVARRICDKLSIHAEAKISDLTEPQINAISTELSTMKIESDLRREVRSNIVHHKNIGTYVGKRHSMGLPVRGQRTRNQAKTAKKLNRIPGLPKEFSTMTLPSYAISTPPALLSTIFPSLQSPFDRFFNKSFW